MSSGSPENAYLSDPLGVLAEEKFESVQLLRNSLDVIQAINTDYDLHVPEPILELLDAFLHAFLLQVLLPRERFSRLSTA